MEYLFNDTYSVCSSFIGNMAFGIRCQTWKGGRITDSCNLSFLPLVLFGLKWKMAYYFFYDKTNSPIVYYSSVVVNITALMWSIIVKEYKPLEEHILKYRQDQWLVPCSENYKENKVLRSIWLVCFIGTVVFSFVCQWG